MTKKEIIKNLQALLAKNGITLSERQSNEVFNYTLVCIRDAVSKSGMCSIPGFGTFKIKQLPAKTGRNPKTQEKIKIPARKVVRFKASKNLLQF